MSSCASAKRVFHRLWADDKVEGIFLANIEEELAFDDHLLGGFDEIDDADIILVQIANPAKPIARRYFEGRLFEAKVMVLPRTNHELMGPEGNLGRVVVTRPVLNVYFHEVPKRSEYSAYRPSA